MSINLKEEYDTVVKNAKSMIENIIKSSGIHNNNINVIIKEIAGEISKLKDCMQQIDSIKEENKQLIEKIKQMTKKHEEKLEQLQKQDNDAKDQSLKENIQQSIQNIEDIIKDLGLLAQSLKTNNENQIKNLKGNLETITKDINNLCTSASTNTPLQTNVGNQDGKIKLKLSNGDIYVTSHEHAALKKYLPRYANLTKEVVLTNLPKLMKRTSHMDRRQNTTRQRQQRPLLRERPKKKPAWNSSTNIEKYGGFRYGNDLDRILRNSPMHTLNNSTPSKQMTLKSKSKTKTKSVSIRTRKNKKVKKINKVKKVKNLKKNKKSIKNKKRKQSKKNKKRKQSKKRKQNKKRKQSKKRKQK